MALPARLRDNATYYFAKLVTAKKGLPAASLVFAIIFSAPAVLTYEAPDNQTTEQTAATVEEIRNNLAIFKEEYRGIKHLEVIEDSNITAFTARQRMRLETVNKFHDDVRPVLERILFDGNLSEQQAEELMREFSENIKPPQQIAEHLHIRNFGYLREHRNMALQNPENDTVEKILAATALQNEVVDTSRWLLPFIFAVFLLIGFPEISKDPTLRSIARTKPKRPPRFKH